MEFKAGTLFTFASFLIIASGMFYFMNQVKKTGSVPIRRLAGLDAIDEAVGRATEMGRPIHFSLGYGDFEANTFVGFEVLRYLSLQAAKYDARLIVTNQSSRCHPINEEIVRQAYIQAGKPENFKPNDVRYLSEQQNAYVAGVIGVMEREHIAANVMVGYFFAESMMFAETGQKVGAIQIAGTTNTAQIPFFVAACDYALIGEEIFAIGAYLNRDPAQVGSLIIQDYAKYAAVLLILVGAIMRTMGDKTLPNLLGM